MVRTSFPTNTPAVLGNSWNSSRTALNLENWVSFQWGSDWKPSEVLSISSCYIYLLNLSFKSVKVDEEVNAGFRESLHTTCVVGSWVDVVNANGVDAQFGHASDVSDALIGVDQRVVRSELVGNT